MSVVRDHQLQEHPVEGRALQRRQLRHLLRRRHPRHLVRGVHRVVVGRDGHVLAASRHLLKQDEELRLKCDQLIGELLRSSAQLPFPPPPLPAATPCAAARLRMQNVEFEGSQHPEFMFVSRLVLRDQGSCVASRTYCPAAPLADLRAVVTTGVQAQGQAWKYGGMSCHQRTCFPCRTVSTECCV